jgi:N-acetylmuramoyl-L-alanine amidase
MLRFWQAALLVLIMPVPHANAVCMKKTFKVVLDVGHTETEAGATSARSVKEYWFNLNLAREIYNKLLADGFESAELLITRGQGPAALRSRSDHANEEGANLFLSIHHDSVQRFYLEKWTYNGAVHQYSDRFNGFSLFVSQENANKNKSLTFASLLSDQLTSRGMTSTAHHAEDIPGERRQFLDEPRGIYRYDKLSVLRLTHAPAVLLEAGIIVNRTEELTAASAERKSLIANAVSTAVAQFCENQAGAP